MLSTGPLTGSSVCVAAERLRILTVRTSSVENTKREDIAFIAFQIWLLGMSLVALLNESIPHMWVQLFGIQ